MEMVINAYALNLSSEEAIAPLSMVGRMIRSIGRVAAPSHVLAITKIALEEEAAG
jgi:hypothetical protein